MSLLHIDLNVVFKVEVDIGEQGRRDVVSFCGGRNFLLRRANIRIGLNAPQHIQRFGFLR